MEDIEKEAIDFVNTNSFTSVKQGFIAGCNSNNVKQQIIKGQIEILNVLATKFQSKYEHLRRMCIENSSNDGVLYNQIAGFKLAKDGLEKELSLLQQEFKNINNNEY